MYLLSPPDGEPSMRRFGCDFCPLPNQIGNVRGAAIRGRCNYKRNVRDQMGGLLMGPWSPKHRDFAIKAILWLRKLAFRACDVTDSWWALRRLLGFDLRNKVLASLATIARAYIIPPGVAKCCKCDAAL